MYTGRVFFTPKISDILLRIFSKNKLSNKDVQYLHSILNSLLYFSACRGRKEKSIFKTGLPLCILN